jgi:hypothetical protein
MLVDALRRMHGYRTIWLDLYDRLWHTEPEHELGRDGWRIVGTFLRPTAEQLTASVGIAMGLDRERRLALTG